MKYIKTDWGKKKFMKCNNLLITCLFKNEDEIANIDVKQKMINDLQHLAEEWKSKGYIKRYVIADDECITERIKD